MSQGPQPVKRTYNLDNLLTFANLGYFEPYTQNIKQFVAYAKHLERENVYLKEQLALAEQEFGVEEVTTDNDDNDGVISNTQFKY
jgi:hypothetical protein